SRSQRSISVGEAPTPSSIHLCSELTAAGARPAMRVRNIRGTQGANDVRNASKGIQIVVLATTAIVAGATHAENEATRAEVFARLPQSVGNIAFTPDN